MGAAVGFVGADGKGRTVSTVDPLPVDIQGATLSLDAAGIEIKNDSGNPIPVNDAGGSLTVDGPLTDAELRATAVPVSGTINTLTGLDIPKHDNIALTYTGENLTAVAYKVGASTVATLTLAYTGSRLDSVTKS
jgi:hypothetical protein